MTQETAKERIYREAFEEIKRVCDTQDHVDNHLLRFFITKKMMEIEKLPATTDKLRPDYWIVSGQVFKNKERFVKQQMEFNPGDIKGNWESSFDHFAIPVYRNPIFVSEYENGVKTSFVRQNKVLQEQLNTAKYFFKNILDVNPNLKKGSNAHLSNCVNVMKNSAEKALAAIGNEGSGDE